MRRAENNPWLCHHRSPHGAKRNAGMPVMSRQSRISLRSIRATLASFPWKWGAEGGKRGRVSPGFRSAPSGLRATCFMNRAGRQYVGPVRNRLRNCQFVCMCAEQRAESRPRRSPLRPAGLQLRRPLVPIRLDQQVVFFALRSPTRTVFARVLRFLAQWKSGPSAHVLQQPSDGPYRDRADQDTA